MTNERTHNKVYINPNFNQRSFINTMPLLTQSNMHVNPYFSQVNSHNNLNQNINLNKRRIFVNPNFIQPVYSFGSNSCQSNLNYEPHSFNLEVQNKPTNSDVSYEQMMSYQNVQEKSEPSSSAVSKSRYTLVRKACVFAANVEKPVNKKDSTIKISKYKTARLSYIKNNLAEQEPKKLSVKLLPNINRSVSKQDVMTKAAYHTSSVNRKFTKINKQNVSIKKSTETKPIIAKKMLANGKKNLLSTSLPVNKKTIARRFKKNNIPCPLYSKYGKCLRNIQKNCEFLHDKKHVSICRKFLKGICHDTSCRFSHELSAKKMPTCHFYLQGSCTKQNCPYLHVKLNNKAKLCDDFLKGYCEKGDKCIYRHVNKDIKTVVKPNMNARRQYSSSPSPTVALNKIKIKTVPKKTELKKKSAAATESEEDKSDPNCRYFKKEEVGEQNVVCDVIKPSRCKLGTLPSFIKL